MTPAQLTQVRDALAATVALINHHYTGSREAMTALQHASDDAEDALALMIDAEVSEGVPEAWMDNDGNVSDNNQYNCFPIPLYTTPPDNPCESKAIVLLRDMLRLGGVDGIRPTRSDGIEVAGLLVHEAVHIWQRYIALIGEDFPGTEQEAYAIQAISQELMESYAIQMGLRK